MLIYGVSYHQCLLNKCQEESSETWINRRYKGIFSFISIQYQFNLDDQFFLIYFKTKLLMINLKTEHCGAFYAPSYHMASFFYYVPFIGLLVKWKVQHGCLIKKNLKYFFESSDIYILFFELAGIKKNIFTFTFLLKKWRNRNKKSI
jgi:hypothetical protein